MPLLEIAHLGHPKIRSGAELVSVEQLQSSAVQQFIDDMVETMRDANGVGIAARKCRYPSKSLRSKFRLTTLDILTNLLFLSPC